MAQGMMQTTRLHICLCTPHLMTAESQLEDTAMFIQLSPSFEVLNIESEGCESRKSNWLLGY